MFLERLEMSDLLSFGVGGTKCELRPLNVLVGPNGSGKSNLIEVIDLLRTLPGDLAGTVRRAGGVQDLLHKGSSDARPTIEAQFCLRTQNIEYRLAVSAVQHRLEVIDERIAGTESHSPLYFGYENGRPILSVAQKKKTLRREDLLPDQSILAQRKDKDNYPELTQLGEKLSKVCIYRNWTFGRLAPGRQPQQVGLPSDVLLEDFSNLALVLADFKLNPKLKDALLKAIYRFSGRFHDFDIKVSGNQVQLFLQDDEWPVPAHRLSDGTLRYLCLLAILMNPSPPPLICLEEPELGMHPDVLPELARLLVQASEKTQIIVTTHSDILVDALTETPECLLIAERSDDSTHFFRREPEELKVWLKEYGGLGQLWLRGELGGTQT